MDSKDNLKDKQHLHWVDWIRFAAAFAVLLTHARASVWVNWGELTEAARTPAAYLVYTVSRFGHEAVIIFFVLSGYLVGGKLIERVRLGAFDPLRYAVDRTTRIYVPYVPALILSGCAWWIAGRPVDFGDFWINILQLQNIAGPSFAGNVALWSLSYEGWFYLIGGMCAVACAGMAGSRSLALVLLALSLAVFTRLLPIYLVCWFIGAVAFGARDTSRPGRDALAGVSLLMIGVLLSQYAFLHAPHNSALGVGFDAKATPLRQIGFLLMCAGVGLGLNVLSAKAPSGRLAQFERLGIGLASGSYTLYLTHYPVLLLCDTLDPCAHRQVDVPALASFGLRLIASAAVAWAFYRLFERNTLSIRQRCMRILGMHGTSPAQP